MKIQILFDGPPEALAGRFVEVEQDGKGVSIGEWRQREDGYWVLEIDDPRRVAGLERQAKLYRQHAENIEAVEDAARDTALEDAARLMIWCGDREAAAAIRAMKK